MVGGEPDLVEACQPLFAAMGTYVVHVGVIGAGRLAKACSQIIVAPTIQAVAEALTLAKKSRAAPIKIRQALPGGFADSRVLELHGRRILDGNYRPGGYTKHHYEDLGFALAAGREAGVPLPATALVATGRGDLDHSALALLLHDLSGLGAPA
jgi:2-hydroxy-3-oxopropionate reductase